MKRFDFASEVAKQLITISSAIVTVVIAFYEKFFSKETIVFYLVFLDLLIFIVSIVLGVLSIGGIVTLIERQERRDARIAADSKLRLSHPKHFVGLFESSAMKIAVWQQLLFFFGLLIFVFVAITDRSGLYAVYPRPVSPFLFPS